MNEKHYGPPDSRDTCIACLFDAGEEFHTPGTPIPMWYSGCQECYYDVHGAMRCRGCWGPWEDNVSRNPQFSHVTLHPEYHRLA